MKQPTLASIYPFPGNADYCHDINFTLIHNGHIYSAEEAKFSSITNDYVSRYPERAMARGFQQLELDPSEVDYWLFGMPAKVDENAQLKLFFQAFFGSQKFINEGEFLEFKKEKIIYVRHQLAHAALAVIASGFNECSFLTLDGGGDAGDQTDSIFGSYSIERGFELIDDQTKIQNGLGAFHTALTRTIGFSNMEDGKATGLASYGQVDSEIEKIMNLYLQYDKNTNRSKFIHQRRESGLPNFSKFKADSYNRWKVWKGLGYESDFSDALVGFNSLDIARTGEEVLVRNAKTVVKELIDITKQPKLALSGGVFQNVFLNSAISRMDCVEETYVPMAPNDAGLSLGAALYVLDEAYRINPKIEVPRQISAHLGPEFSDSEILNELKLWPVTYSSPLDLNKSAAKSIADGKVVGWFQGKQELGPRALGSRSVLGNPKDKAIKAKVNQVLKKRDWFMPYAPSCLFEHSQEYFTDGPNAQFMSFALTPKTDSLPNEVIANISHVDGTSRAQFVKIEDNSGFHDLISEFYKISGVSILLNTSFNRHGIATISSPKQALEHLVCGNVEELYIGGYKVNSLIQVTPENSILFPESLEILMISLQPFFNYYSGKSNIFPKPSATLDKYLDIFSLEIHKNRLSSALVNIDLGSDVKGIRDQLSSLMSDNS